MYPAHEKKNIMFFRSVILEKGIFLSGLQNVFFFFFWPEASSRSLLYSITSMARTRIDRLPWLIGIFFSVPTKFF